MIRRHLICECGNRDDDDVSSLAAPLPPCSADCGRVMTVASTEAFLTAAQLANWSREGLLMTDTTNITQERAARRFAQIATLERFLSFKLTEVAAAKAHCKELQEEADGLIARIRTAARDDGELPLFDLDGR